MILLLLAAINMVLSIALHEGGHLVLGLASGYRFVSYNLLGLVWVKEGGRLRLRRSKNALIGGQCLMAPPAAAEAAPERCPYFWYNAGGGLFNLALGALLLAGLLLVGGGGGYLGAFFLMGAMVNAVMALLNLIPMSPGLPNDGLNILTAGKSPLARRGLYLMLKVNGEVQAGKRYRDYPAEAFAAEVPPGSRNYLEAYLLMLQAARLEDMGEHEAAMAVYRNLDLERLNGYYATAIRIDMLYYYCVYSGEPEKARELYADRRVRRMLENPMPSLLRVKAAAQVFLLGQRDAARLSMEKARALLEQSPSLGLRAMEIDALEELSEAMEASEQNSLDWV